MYGIIRIQTKEALIKFGAQIAPSDFLSGCQKKAAGRLTPVKDFLSKMTENMQARCVPSRQAG